MSKSRRLVAALVLIALPAACQPAPGGGGDTPGEGGSRNGGRGGKGGSPGAGGDSSGGSGGSGSGGSGSGGSGGFEPPDANSGPTDGGADTPADECGKTPNSLLCNPLAKMPKSIKETGLFPSAPDLSKVPSRMLEFVPDPPLWSNGLDKQRFLLLPKSTKVDNSNSKEWIFPIGTIMVKTFFDDSGMGGQKRAIETRFIRRIADKDSAMPYDFYLYKWNDKGDDAALIVNDIDGDVTMDMPVQVTINRMVNSKPFMINGGKPFMHSLPSRQMCGDCHEESGKLAQTFIGFDEIRLNSNRPGASKTQLQEFADMGIFTGAIPANPAKITGSDPVAVRVKSFVLGNCAHCHHGKDLEDFRPEAFEKNTVGVAVRPTQSVMPPPGYLRIFPKNPMKSVVYLQTTRTMLPPPVGETKLRPMPPVGVTDLAPDQQALADMVTWINSLPAK